MSKIKIKNFGPIKEGYGENDGWLDVKKITVFIGNQGSGKSTVAKLISTLSWIEKALVRGDLREKDLQMYNRFRKQHCAYQNIHNYFNSNSEIEYEGEAYSFQYIKGAFTVTKNQANNYYLVPKIMYVPAERNFVSTVDNPTTLKKLPSTLYTFLDEFENAKKELKDSIVLPIGNVKFEYQRQANMSFLVGADYKIRLSESSSGFQSLAPLYLVTRFLALSINKDSDASKKDISIEEEKRIRREIEKILSLNNKLSDEVKKVALEYLSSRFKNSCFLNIVEEPEQNLFPSSQRNILNSLLEFSNLTPGNKLVLTTHSPYIINYLTLAVKAHMVSKKIESSNKQNLNSDLIKIVPLASLIDPESWVIYELTDGGGIIKLPDYEKLPSDENYLNQRMAESNELFANLLDIEDLCQ